jgi:hypothetical protein
MRPSARITRWAALLSLVTAMAPAAAFAYPLDEYEETGITRLQAYWLAKQSILDLGILSPGAFWPTTDIGLRMTAYPDFELPTPEAELTETLRELLGDEANRYGISLLDFTDPAAPVFAELNGSQQQNPGSVGKVLVLLAWFQALADTYPDDIEARFRVMADTQITANAFIRNDHHNVPFWQPGDPKVLRRPIEEGDTANIFTFFDWTASASSNAAASMMMSQVILLKAFGTAYPPSEAEATAYFEQTPKAELSKLFMNAMQDPIRRNGMDVAQFRQGGFFSREGKKRVPGTNSTATSHQLLKFVVLMEQGKLVDPWSSLEIKKLLYLTDGRIRYASSPVLSDAAVYYKSGSFYGCKVEKGFDCGAYKYRGNRFNFMNSVAIVETPPKPGKTQLRYLVVVLSNVLKKNSAELHRDMATEIHRMIKARHAPQPAVGSTSSTGSN